MAATSLALSAATSLACTAATSLACTAATSLALSAATWSALSRATSSATFRAISLATLWASWAAAKVARSLASFAHSRDAFSATRHASHLAPRSILKAMKTNSPVISTPKSPTNTVKKAVFHSAVPPTEAWNTSTIIALERTSVSRTNKVVTSFLKPGLSSRSSTASCWCKRLPLDASLVSFASFLGLGWLAVVSFEFTLDLLLIGQVVAGTRADWSASARPVVSRLWGRKQQAATFSRYRFGYY